MSTVYFLDRLMKSMVFLTNSLWSFFLFLVGESRILSFLKEESVCTSFTREKYSFFLKTRDTKWIEKNVDVEKQGTNRWFHARRRSSRLRRKRILWIVILSLLHGLAIPFLPEKYRVHPKNFPFLSLLTVKSVTLSNKIIKGCINCLSIYTNINSRLILNSI